MEEEKLKELARRESSNEVVPEWVKEAFSKIAERASESENNDDGDEFPEFLYPH